MGTGGTKEIGGKMYSEINQLDENTRYSLSILEGLFGKADNDEKQRALAEGIEKLQEWDKAREAVFKAFQVPS